MIGASDNRAAAPSAFDPGGECRKPSRSPGHEVTHPFPQSALMLIRPAFLFGVGLPLSGGLGAVGQTEDKESVRGDCDALNPFRKDLLVKLIKTENFRGDLLQYLFGNVLRRAESRTDPAGAATPGDITIGVGRGKLCLVAPLIPHIAFAAEPALDLSRKTGDVQALIGQNSEFPPSGDLFLHKLKGLHVYDGLVVVFHIVLRELALVLLVFFGDGIFDEFLLQKQVPRIGDVGEHALDVRVHPRTAVTGFNALRSEFLLRVQAGFAVKEVLIDPLNDGRLFGNRHQFISLPAVAVHPEFPVGYSLFKALSRAPFHILGNAPALLLSEGGQQGKHELAVAGQRPNAFFLELHLDAELLQPAHRFKEIHRIAGKPADGLGEDNVDPPGLAVGQHPLKLGSAFRAGAGDESVCVNSGKLPFGILLDKLAVIAYLGGKGMGQTIRFHGDPGIGRHPFSLRRGLSPRADFSDCFHNRTSYLIPVLLALILRLIK